MAWAFKNILIITFALILIAPKLLAGNPNPPTLSQILVENPVIPKALQSRADQYIKLKRGRMSASEKTLWLADCLTHSQDVFCQAATRDRRGNKKRDLASTSVEDLDLLTESIPVDSKIVFKNIITANLKPLKPVGLGSLHRALRQVQNWDQIHSIAYKAIESGDCNYRRLLFALGQKTEEFLPDKKYLMHAKTLYSRAAQCSVGIETADNERMGEKALYRLSLLTIWSGDCIDAIRHLSTLAAIKDGDYVSRSLYWKTQCAAQTGNKLLAESTKGRLIREYPLSYHGLLLSPRPNQNFARSLGIVQPFGAYRTQRKTELNPWIEAIEALTVRHAGDLAYEFFDYVEERLDNTEAPFRLYVAVLARKAGHTFGKFKLLASLFRDDPSMITKATLELFYPLQRLDVVKHYGSKIDPLLIAALIRQESGFNEQARSPAGALGLMQLMPSTARTMERVTKRELLDARTNVRLGVKYFGQLLKRFDYDAELALASYNAGPERVDEWKRRYVTQNRMLFLDLIPYTETRNYVVLIARNYLWYMSLYGHQVPQAGKYASHLISLKRSPF